MSGARAVLNRRKLICSVGSMRSRAGSCFRHAAILVTGRLNVTWLLATIGFTSDGMEA